MYKKCSNIKPVVENTIVFLGAILSTIFFCLISKYLIFHIETGLTEEIQAGPADGADLYFMMAFFPLVIGLIFPVMIWFGGSAALTRSLLRKYFVCECAE